MRILILSFYYQPDLCAGSFRTFALVKALLDVSSNQGLATQIELVSTLPNRYSSFTSEAPALEKHPNLIVHRVALSAHKSGMLDQSRAFLDYAKSVVNLVKGKEYDLVYATSSRLMTAALGAYIARRIGKPLYLDIRDIFVDTIKDVLSRRIAWAMNPVFSCLERWAVNSANKVNLVSAGFLPYFRERYPSQTFVQFTNGIDDEFLIEQPSDNQGSTEKVLRVVYAGNIGEGQGLHAIIPELAKKYEGRLQFRIIGDGGRRGQLVSALDDAGCSNVILLPPIKRDELIKEYRAADVLFLHLNDYDAFRKVLPSKIFEYAALGKPIWAGVAGYAADFITDNVPNAAVFNPCDVDGASASFSTLEMVTKPRSEFVSQFSRAAIMQKMAKDIISLSEIE
ncbi:glycosyltransferase family 4 protein [Stutzerimonas nitrititolerans]|uniref:glycosyltransferase family 4 protein n=1 Tax=Stutzerimonas nitrititolerans TaxID=2482751 RepID=UPI0002FB1737|nr:glycosyltransferase family 4 protein [Stutzerimonas nitrititolerans]